MVMAVVDAGSSSSSSSSSFQVVICLEVVATLLVVETLLFFFFLGVTHLTVVTSGSVIILSGEVNHPLSCFLTSLLEKYTSLFKKFFTKLNFKKENDKKYNKSYLLAIRDIFTDIILQDDQCILNDMSQSISMTLHIECHGSLLHHTLY